MPSGAEIVDQVLGIGRNLASLLGAVWRASSGFVGQAAAAGFGAWAAFRFESRRKSGEERNAQVLALKEALFVLSSQRNLLIRLDRQFLAPHREDRGRFLSIQPTFSQVGAQRQELARLTFLIGDGTAGDLLSRIEHGEGAFQNVIAALQTRSALHFQMQARLERATPQGPTIDSESIRQVIGPALFEQLRQLTDAIYEQVEEATKLNRETVSRIQQHIATRFPGERIPTVIEDRPIAG